MRQRKTWISKEVDKEIGIEEVIEILGFGRYQYYILAFAVLCWIADAFEIMILSFLSYSVSCYWNLERTQTAFLSTAVFLGMMIGAASWGQISDKYGRRYGLILSNGVVLLAGIASALAPNFISLLFFRVLVGCGVSGGHIAVTLFSEFSPGKKRAFWLTILEIWFALGSVLEALLAWIILPNFGEDSWRILLLVSAIPSAVSLYMSFYVPESPRWLILNNREEEARNIIDQVARVNNFFPVPFTTKNVKQEQSGSFMELFSEKYRSTTLLLWIIWLISSMVYYGLVILAVEMAKAGQDNSCTFSMNKQNENTTLPLCSPIPNDRYLDIVTTSFGELPAFL
jgi:MFS family permease